MGAIAQTAPKSSISNNSSKSFNVGYVVLNIAWNARTHMKEYHVRIFSQLSKSWAQNNVLNVEKGSVEVKDAIIWHVKIAVVISAGYAYNIAKVPQRLTNI